MLMIAHQGVIQVHLDVMYCRWSTSMELKLMSFNVASTAGEGWSWVAIGVIADQIDNEKRPRQLAPGRV